MIWDPLLFVVFLISRVANIVVRETAARAYKETPTAFNSLLRYIGLGSVFTMNPMREDPTTDSTFKNVFMQRVVVLSRATDQSQLGSRNQKT